MNTTQKIVSTLCGARRFVAFGLVFAGGIVSGKEVAPSNVETKVVSHVYNGYARMKLADGSYQPETYVFANGGTFDGEPVAGDTISFNEVARIVRTALKGQNFLSTNDPQATQQMIVLWYGTTRRTVDKPTAYELIDDQNARILGFQKEMSRASDLSFTSFAHDFYDEFRAGRYFVVLKAYDFQMAQKEKRLKLLWESRFSVQRQAVGFADQLPAMARFAARTFGRETKGILDPDAIKGDVKLGELKIIGPESR